MNALNLGWLLTRVSLVLKELLVAPLNRPRDTQNSTWRFMFPVGPGGLELEI